MPSFRLGTVSHGTMRNADLLPALAAEVDYQISHNGKVNQAWCIQLRKLVNGALAVDPESDAAPNILDELFEALDELAPPYVRFGAHEGDGSDYGFWPCLDSLDEAVHDGHVLQVNDLADIPHNYHGDIMLVSDHGNITFGQTEVEFVEVWSTV